MKKIFAIKFLFLFLFFTCADYDLMDEDPSQVTVYINSVTDSTIEVKWTKSDDIDFKNYVLFMDQKPSVNLTSDNVVDTIQFRGDTVYKVTGLDSLTKYYFAVTVNTNRERYSKSLTIDTTTLRRFTKKIIFTDSLFTKIDSIRIQWKYDVVDDSVLDKYYIYKDTVPFTSLGARSFKETDTNFIWIDSLYPDKTYYIKIRGTKKNVTAQSDSLVYKVPSLPIPNIDNIEVTDKTAKFYLSKPFDPRTKYFGLKIDTSNTFGNISGGFKRKPLIDTLFDKDTITIINKLVQAKKYFAVAYTKSRLDSISKFSSVQEFVTDKSAPDSVKFLKDLSKTDSSIILRWNKNTNIDFKKYVLSFYIDTMISFETLHEDSIQDDTTYLVKNLKNYQYHFSVHVIDKDGNVSANNDTIPNYPVFIKLNKDTITDSIVRIDLRFSSYVKDIQSYDLYRDTIANVTSTDLLIKSGLSSTDRTINDTLKNFKSGQSIYYRAYYKSKGISNLLRVVFVKP